jgi:hypothetical protein
MGTIWRVEGQRHHDTRIPFTNGEAQPLYSVWQGRFGNTYPVLHVQSGDVDISSHLEIHCNTTLPATGTVAVHVSHPRSAVHLGFNGSSGGLFHRLRICPGEISLYGNCWRRYVGVLCNGKIDQRNNSYQHQHDRYHDGCYRPFYKSICYHSIVSLSPYLFFVCSTADAVGGTD